MRRIPAACIVAFSLALPATAVRGQRFEPLDMSGLSWFKGNTHTHTTESDGDSPPEYVARWYRNHGYNFLVLSDHNVLTDPLQLAALVDLNFILIPGEEVTSGFSGRPVHVNGLNLARLVEPRTDSTLVGTIQQNVNAVREAEGVPHINHPNFGWAFSADELKKIENDKLLEIYNGHPTVHNAGGGGTPGMEEVWDILLSGGKRIYGIAVDDAHDFQGEFAPDRANPGRGWVAVKAPRLVSIEIMVALESGRFYASTGVELDEVTVTPTTLEVRVKPRGSFRYTITFIGDNGQVLSRVPGPRATFDLTRHERTLTYVRARVDDSGGYHAWVQPAFITR